MILTLEVIGEQAEDLGAGNRKVFNGVGGTIGRLPDNDWVFPDPYVSGRHALVRYLNGKFFVEDTSTNGVFLNSRDNRLSRAQPHPLKNGDTLYIDAYQIKVSIEGDAAKPKDDLFGSRLGAVQGHSGPAGGSPPPKVSPSPPAAPLRSPVVAAALPVEEDRTVSMRSKDEVPDADDQGTEWFSINDVPDQRAAGHASAPPAQIPVRPPAMSTPAVERVSVPAARPAPAIDDSQTQFLGKAPHGKPDQGRPDQGKPEQGKPDQAKPDEGRQQQERAESGQQDQRKPGPGRPLQSPPGKGGPARTPAMVESTLDNFGDIEDDEDESEDEEAVSVDDNRTEFLSPKSPPVSVPQPLRSVPTPAPVPTPIPTPKVTPSPAAASHSADQAAPPPPAHLRGGAVPAVAPVVAAAKPTSPPASPRIAAETSTAAPSAARAPAPTATPAAGTPGALLQELMSAAGISGLPASPELAHTLGLALRSTVSGLMEALRAREELRDELRMRGTTFKAAQNNPLKFSANVDDAFHNLLVKRNAAYLTPAEAFEDGFRDVCAHQTAIMVAMRLAFEAMLAHFDPDRLQGDFDRHQKKGSILGVPAKLRYWELYRDRYADFTRDAEASFRQLFGDDFAKAYEEQLERLRLQRRS